MEKETENIYSYRNDMGIKVYTPNAVLAHARAEFYGTNSVFVETYEVEPRENR